MPTINLTAESDSVPIACEKGVGADACEKGDNQNMEGAQGEYRESQELLGKDLSKVMDDEKIDGE